MSFPPAFIQFIKDNGLELNDYILQEELPRYIRNQQVSLEDLQSELGDTVKPVEWFPDFYELSSTVKIVNSALYKKGHIFGMDLASAIAVHALSISPNDHVLDLCCAPGGKLCYIADLQGPDSKGTVTGVDITEHRLSTCKRICQKYRLERYRLFRQDGCTFYVHAPSQLAQVKSPLYSDPNVNISQLPRTNTKPFFATKLLRADVRLKHPTLLYDKVLVDAECTHDSSFSHLSKQENQNWEDFDKIMNEEKLAKLEQLQQGLIQNGFNMLKPGGILVYSTCSFSRKQNEDIVVWLLGQHKNARLEKVENADTFPAVSSDCQSEIPGYEYMLRFTPAASKTSGLFIARIRKVE